MDNQNKQPETHTDFRKTGDANRQGIFRLAAVAVVLYWLYEIVTAYLAGGPDAPSLTLLLVAIAVLGGGGLAVVLLTLKSWKRAKKDAVMTEEEVAQLEALRQDDEEA